MKINATCSPLLTSDNMESSVMAMDIKGMEIATWYMRDKIYSNKIQAVVREYLCNAIDEHNKFQVEQAVEVGIRRENNEDVFFVRDHAKGLNEDSVRSIFGMYFRSTKSKSNDSIGGFGVGSKAGHCYGDTFFVTSHFQGKKSTYTCVLGGGGGGVPIGHIYKINESDTLETGLEICVPMNSADKNDFSREIKSFVSFSPANIQGCIYNDFFEPNETVKSFESNGLKFRLTSLKDSPFYRSTSFIVQMGGVTYKRIECNSFRSILGHDIVVDAPIGSMSVPLSRECFENTLSNNNFLAKIEKTINDLAEKDLSIFQNKTPLEFLEDGLANLSTHQVYEGEFFSAKKSFLFKDIYQAMNHAWKVMPNFPIVTKKGKPVLLVFPRRGRPNYWKSKVANHCKKTEENFYAVEENDLYAASSNVDKIKEHFTLLSVKQVKYEKEEKSAEKLYTVYDKNGNKVADKVNALEIHNLRRERMSLPLATDKTEAMAQAEDHFKKCSSPDEASLYSIKIKGGRFHHSSFRCNSPSLINEMMQLGWIDYNSSEFQKITDHFVSLQKIAREKERIRANSFKKWVNLSQRTRDALQKDKNALKVSFIWERIAKEESLRSKIISSLDSGYYTPNKYSRSELRKILQLK